MKTIQKPCRQGQLLVLLERRPPYPRQPPWLADRNASFSWANPNLQMRETMRIWHIPLQRVIPTQPGCCLARVSGFSTRDCCVSKFRPIFPHHAIWAFLASSILNEKIVRARSHQSLGNLSLISLISKSIHSSLYYCFRTRASLCLKSSSAYLFFFNTFIDRNLSHWFSQLIPHGVLTHSRPSCPCQPW